MSEGAGLPALGLVCSWSESRGLEFPSDQRGRKGASGPYALQPHSPQFGIYVRSGWFGIHTKATACPGPRKTHPRRKPGAHSSPLGVCQVRAGQGALGGSQVSGERSSEVSQKLGDAGVMRGGRLSRLVSEERPTEEALFGLRSEGRRETWRLESH